MLRSKYFMWTSILICYFDDVHSKCIFQSSELKIDGTNKHVQDGQFSDITCYNTTIEDYTYELFELDVRYRNLTNYLQLRIIHSFFLDIHYLINPLQVNKYMHSYSNLARLSLNFCRINKVGEGAFKDFAYLRELDMGFNDIDEMNFVSYLSPTVKIVNLTHNKITNVNFGLFGLPIEVLDLSFNRIVDAVFSSKVPFWSFPIKKNLSLHNNYIVQVQIHPIVVSEPLEVNLANNNLSSIVFINTDYIPFNVHFQLLDLSQALTNLSFLGYPKSYISTSKLIVSKNSLLTLDKKYDFYPTSYIDFSKCSLSNIHQNIFQESVFTYLNFSYNNLKLLSGSLFAISQIQILDLSHNHIEDILHVFQDAHIKYLNLSHNRIFELDGKSFTNLKYVYDLDLSFNNISLKAHSFQNCKTLSALNLASNNIVNIVDLAFYNLSQLTKLNLENNFLKNMSFKIFQPLKSIEEINLTNNKLTIITSQLFSNLPLKKIMISGNYIQKIQTQSFHNLSNIEEILINENHKKLAIENSAFCGFSNPHKALNIYLKHSKVGRITSKMFSNIALLNVLDITDNNLTSIDFSGHIEYLNINDLRVTFNGVLQKKTFLTLVNLQKLLFSNSDIKNIENNAFQGLFNLKVIEVQNSTVHNMSIGALKGLFVLEELDSFKIFKKKHVLNSHLFTDMYKLKYLNLSFIELRNMEPHTFEGLKSLKVLDLSHNNISHFMKSTFSGLSLLKCLDLSYNQLTVLKRDDFDGLGNLTSVSFNNNNINDIDLGFFQNTPQLEKISIAHNNLTLFKVGTFSNLLQLIDLDLQNNRISALPLESFLPLTSLESLNLDSNNLKTIEQFALASNLKHLRRMSIANNKWKCEYLADILVILKNYSIDYSTVNNNYYEDNIDGIRCIDVCKFLLCLKDSHGIN